MVGNMTHRTYIPNLDIKFPRGMIPLPVGGMTCKSGCDIILSTKGNNILSMVARGGVLC